MPVLKTYNTRIEAEIAQSLLAANHIETMILADDEGGMAPFPFQPNTTGIKLMVKKEEYEKALQLLTKEHTR